MNEPIKILFDENFGEPLVTALAHLFGFHPSDQRVVICHVFKFAKRSEKDEIWVPRIAPGNWLVISHDRGKRCGGKKLPDVCREYGVTHIMLSGTLQAAKQFEKIRAVVSVWPKITQAYGQTRGTRFTLRYDGKAMRVVLVECLPGTSTPTAAAARSLEFDSRPKRRRSLPRKRISKPIPEEERLFKNTDTQSEGGAG